QLANSGATPEQMAALKAEMGLDKSVFGQLIDWGKNALQGDLGSSLWSGKEVSQIILDRLPVTIQLALMAIVLAIIIGIPIGVISAVKQNSFIDHFLKVISIGGLSIPSFWL